MLNTRNYYLSKNVAQVAFRSIMLTGIVLNEYVCYFGDQNHGIPQKTASIYINF